MKSLILRELEEHRAAFERVSQTLVEPLTRAAELVIATLERGGKVLLFGNGGSAADAQHLSAELVGRFRIERPGLPAIALSTDTSALTAIGNDYGYENVFRRQVEALARRGDTLIGLSTSGNSANVLAALECGRAAGCTTIGFAGRKGGRMGPLCDVLLVVPHEDTARIQEMHITLGHILCALVDSRVGSAARHE